MQANILTYPSTFPPLSSALIPPSTMSEKRKFVPAYEKEAFWFERRMFLEKAGYRLRPKFNPGFVGPKPPGRYHLGDDHTAQHPRKHIMDAERISDGQEVMLKWVSRRTHPCEVEIGCLFSTPSSSNNPRNHCIPILDVLQDPQDDDKQIIVMPRLIRFDEPMFDTVGEVIDCWRQIFEGVQFMHENFVAHRDFSLLNILQDPTKLFPRGFHPVNYCLNPTNDGLAYSITRTECWPRYYIIDFGLSRRYDPSKGPPLERVTSGGDGNPPEYAGTECNPFPADIYCLGNILKRHFIRSDPSCWGENHTPLQFLKPLADDMTHKNPAKRPTIGEVIQRFNKECEHLSQWHLRKPGQAMEWNAWLDQMFRRIKNTFKGVAPLPRTAPPSTRALSPRMRAFYTKTPKLEEKERKAH
ncbi:kinase-like domain-containing protein [Mycena maculata]|uniref:Kinase-like domain-containing protein n=1 Tax=Mycena maculata TaxID=230809 RepID=A0AAD7I437_9AGAR|nr:kinase-like domain-containing protein [Mycena maculata]